MSGRKPAAATPSAVKCEIGQNDKLDLDNVVESFQQRRFAKSAANFVSSAKKAGCLHVVFRIPPKMLATQFDGLKVRIERAFWVGWSCFLELWWIVWHFLNIWL